MKDFTNNYNFTDAYLEGPYNKKIYVKNFYSSDHPHVSNHTQPMGGLAESVGIKIQFQNGPVSELNPINGAFVEDLLLIALRRLEFYESNYNSACKENAMTINKIEQALTLLNQRRFRQSVECHNSNF